MSLPRPSAVAAGPGALALAAGLLALAVPAWLFVVRDAATMTMPGMAPSLAEGVAFTAEWGVMMTAMMLPSAAPTILLYRTVRRRLAANGERAVPAAAFAAVYLLLWAATGIPVYAAHLAVGAAAARWPALAGALPYAVAGALVAAGAYQLTAAKRACLRRCESPLGFLMRRWRAGHVQTLRLAAEHAGWCIGCCWALMAILVAVGAMSLPWVVAIAAVVLAEKVAPGGARIARLAGLALVALGLLVAVRPELAGTLRGAHAMEHGAASPMPSMPHPM